MGTSSETIEYAADVWWTGGSSACRKFELPQVKMGRRLLRGKQYSSVRGSAGRSRMEEAGGKEGEMKVMFGKRLEMLEEARFCLKKVVTKLREDGGFGWWEEYEVLRRKYELGSE